MSIASQILDNLDLDLEHVRHKVRTKCRQRRSHELDQRREERQRKAEERRREAAMKEAAEEADKKKAVEEARRRAEAFQRQQRKERQEAEAALQREAREWRALQRSYGVKIPETPPPREIHLFECTPPSALSACADSIASMWV